jgi:hypothetical protein
MDFPNMEDFNFGDLIDLPEYDFATGKKTTSHPSSALNNSRELGLTGQSGPLKFQSLPSSETYSGSSMDSMQFLNGDNGNFTGSSQAVRGPGPTELYNSGSVGFYPYVGPSAGYGTIAQYQAQNLPSNNLLAGLRDAQPELRLLTHSSCYHPVYLNFISGKSLM